MDKILDNKRAFKIINIKTLGNGKMKTYKHIGVKILET